MAIEDTPDLQREAQVVSTVIANYSVFSTWKKRYIVSLVALAGWFSTLSSFMYYPVIDIIAKDLHTTVGKINLTVTSYMVVSAVAPAIVGDAADRFGRRPFYIISLTIYFLANMGIALQKRFVALLLLRMLQSAGISATFSIAYGVIGDIAAPAERGSYVSALSFGIMTAPSIGPVIGGALGYSVGWRWIFWFLCIVSGSCLTLMSLTLPETARTLVGNGSIEPPITSKLPFQHFSKYWQSKEAPYKWDKTFPNPWKSISLLMQKDTGLVILAGGAPYMTWSCIHASLATLFIDLYHLNQFQAGLIYLPFGVGCTVSTLISAKTIDRDYRKTAEANGLPIDRAHGDDLNKFPIEEARLRSMLWPIVSCTMSVIGYGWTLHVRTHLAVPLVLLFFAGFSIQTTFNIHNTLLVDTNHESPAAAQASNNFVRCSLSAIAVAFLQNLLGAAGVGWTFTFFGMLCALSGALYMVERHYGMRWRLARLHLRDEEQMPQKKGRNPITISSEQVIAPCERAQGTIDIKTAN